MIDTLVGTPDPDDGGAVSFDPTILRDYELMVFFNSHDVGLYSAPDCSPHLGIYAPGES